MHTVTLTFARYKRFSRCVWAQCVSVARIRKHYLLQTCPPTCLFSSWLSITHSYVPIPVPALSTIHTHTHTHTPHAVHVETRWLHTLQRSATNMCAGVPAWHSSSDQMSRHPLCVLVLPTPGVGDKPTTSQWDRNRERGRAKQNITAALGNRIRLRNTLLCCHNDKEGGNINQRLGNLNQVVLSC